MTYDTFARLLQAKFMLVRILHTIGPGDAPAIRRTVADIERWIRECDRYESHIRRYAQTMRTAG